MTQDAPIIGSYAGGEITPYLVGRTDHKRYYVSLKILENAVSLPHGPAERRGGTRMIAEVKDSANAVRGLPFEFSDIQAYSIEAGPGYFRFYMNKAQLLDGAAAYEIATPYGADDLADLWICQSYDIAWVLHPSYTPKKLSRTGHTSWTLVNEEFIDGPYLDENTTTTTLTPSAVSGSSVTVTASAVDGINDGQGFLSTDVGRLLRIGHAATAWAGGTAYAVGDVRTSSGNTYRCTSAGTSSSSTTLSGTGEGIADGTCLWTQIGSNGIGWGYGKVLTVPSTTEITVEIEADLGKTDATAVWRMGLWSTTTGWPSVATFHQERLVYGSATALRPQRLDGSKVGEFNNFTPGVNNSDPIAVSLGSNKVNKIRWLVSARVLLVGTVGAEFVVSADTPTTPLTPTNIQATPHTRHGCAAIPPVETGLSVLFVQRQKRKIRELQYDLNVDGYIAPELSLFAEQATRTGWKALCWQQEPWGIVWGAREDGQLVGCTYLPEQEVIAFHRHPLADEGMVESVWTIPGGTGADELWMVVRREIGGQTKRFIEVLEEPLELDGRQSDAFYVDCGLSLENTVDMALTPGATTGTGITFTVDADLFDAEDVGREIHYDYKARVKIKGRYIRQWTKARARITDVTDARTVTADIIYDFPSTDEIAAGEWRLSVTAVSGLDHLEGKTVQILADGGVHPDAVVTGGAIALDWPASKVHVGLGFVTVIEPMPLEVGSATKRIVDLRLRLLRSLGGWYGRDEDSLEQILYRSITDPLDEPTPLFTGDMTVTFPGEWETVGDLLMVQDLPLPFTVAASIPTVEISVD